MTLLSRDFMTHLQLSCNLSEAFGLEQTAVEV